MNWYKKSQSSLYNYHTMHRPGDAVWIYTSNGDLQVDYAKTEEGRMTHNRSFGQEGKNFLFKGRYNPSTKLVSITSSSSFISSNQEYVKKRMEDQLYREFGSDINIKYF